MTKTVKVTGIHIGIHNCFGHLKERLKDHRHEDFDQLNIAIANAILELNQRGTFNGVT
jgi:hypothetical protein